MSTQPPPHWPAPSPRQDQGEPALNGFALASLLVGLVCLPPLGIVFGIVALVQIAGKGERGRPLAITGLAVSLVTTVLLFLAVDRAAEPLFSRLDGLSPYEDVAGEVADIDELRAGDCFNVPGGDLMDEDPLFYRVACTEPHHGEVTSSARFDPAHFRGGRQMKRAATEACWRAQDSYAMDSWALPAYAELFWFAPSREGAGGGERRLLCVIGTADEEHRGSLRRDAGLLQPDQVAFLHVMNEADLALGHGPDEDLHEALPAYREWAREVDRALAAESRVLEEAAARRPELAGPARAQLKEVAAARAAWQKAGAAVRPADFQGAWDQAVASLTVATEKALRGAYGLSAVVPEWLSEDERRGGADEGPDAGSGGGSGGGAGGGSGGRPGGRASTAPA
ncbi:DUF4190 domain-containing protein [Streptomyces sp. BR123]|uniref:DUF4190 domain-containing protein n=1 Tax=Streptomyces sp. BR123 TaxID=2749828 RepID=UPI0015C4544A|nr:DUF4190 domain-containing protein [Streptomyces sp. BR123]NXY93405.1 DUF4190 domain-containing protein [Streptomyces sp. BR123]